MFFSPALCNSPASLVAVIEPILLPMFVEGYYTACAPFFAHVAMSG
ncbi:MAG: hypothetical protein JST28_16075 [Acidobacteria bacterium]|nr:hypothetical protein [Acidobacteriota bacterium]